MCVLFYKITFSIFFEYAILNIESAGGGNRRSYKKKTNFFYFDILSASGGFGGSAVHAK